MLINAIIRVLIPIHMHHAGILTTATSVPSTESLAGGTASTSLPIHLDEVVCTGNERDVTACSYSIHNCMHTEDTGIRCGESIA